MAEYIDLDTPLELKAAWGRTYKPYTSTLRELLDVNQIPYTAADVRPVVLCRDCKWTKTDGMDEQAIYCVQWDRWEVPTDGFCWLGEKREES